MIGLCTFSANSQEADAWAETAARGDREEFEVRNCVERYSGVSVVSGMGVVGQSGVLQVCR